jgi:hypothetical protein
LDESREGKVTVLLLFKLRDKKRKGGKEGILHGTVAVPCGTLQSLFFISFSPLIP